MRIGILSDIHGNDRALTACLSYLEMDGVDAYCFLGDYIGELPGVDNVCKILRKLEKEKPCYIIKGNKEDYILRGLCEGHPEWDEYKSVVGMLRYSAASINQETKNYLCNLPTSLVVKIGDLPEIVICHGSPNNCKKPVLSHKYGINQELLDSIDYRYIIHGHTHYQEYWEGFGKHVWNPGSVGLPCNSRPETQFMVIEDKDGEWVPKFYNIKYDYMSVVQDLHDCNLYEIAPYWTKSTETLITGKNKVSNGKMLEIAMQLCKEQEGYCEWPKVPEKYMKEAFEILYEKAKLVNKG